MEAPTEAPTRSTTFLALALAAATGSAQALPPRPALAPGGGCTPAWVPTFGPVPGLEGGELRAFVEFDDGTGPALYMAGTFPGVAGVGANDVARWDGSTWSPVGGGMNDMVMALAVYDDGTGPALHAAGRFSQADGLPASRIAKWDGASWSEVGGGISDWVFALEVYDDGSGPRLYAGGCFYWAGGNTVQHLAAWDGASWSSPGLMESTVRALETFDDGAGEALFVGGDFTDVDGALMGRIARYDGSWSKLAGGVNNRVHALAVHDDGAGPALYAGGEFSNADSTPQTRRLARWDGASWSSVGGGLAGEPPGTRVEALASVDLGSGPALWVGGIFSTVGGNVPAASVARWDGAWSGLGAGIGWSSPGSGTVYALGSFDDGTGRVLFAGGLFDSAGGWPAFSVATWDGAAWAPLSDGLDGWIRALAVWDDGTGPALYAGGGFSAAQGTAMSRIGRWDGTSWSPLGAGVDSAVLALAVHDDGSGPALYAAGTFDEAGGAPALRVARWDGATWSPVGAGITGTFASGVNALAVFDDGGGPALYAGGSFSVAAGAPGDRIVKWDGAQWLPLPSSPDDGGVMSLAVHDDGSGPALYAGGWFTSAGGVPAQYVARFDGASWSALGAGVVDYGEALASFDDGSGPALWVGTDVRFDAPSGVARWDGAAWADVGSLSPNLGGTVEVLAVLDEGAGPALYAGGTFAPSADPSGPNGVMRWDGAAWQTLGGGATATYALAVLDDGGPGGPVLYAAGSSPDSGDSALSAWTDGCDQPVVYCTPKASSAGCLARIGTSDPDGMPVSGASDYSVVATDVHAFRTGFVLTGISGPSAQPFFGGTLCVAPPQKRGPQMNAGGTAIDTCTGAFGTLVNTGVVVPFGLDGGPGNSVWYQYWYRDPPNGPGLLGTALSDAVRLDYL